MTCVYIPLLLPTTVDDDDDDDDDDDGDDDDDRSPIVTSNGTRPLHDQLHKPAMGN